MHDQPSNQQEEHDRREDHLQESQYAYPYHYIPEYGDKSFSQTQHWEWGFRYLGGMKVVFDQLSEISFDSLVDVGCGDGRFLREVDKRFTKKKTLGVDYSERAIKLAQAMNPNLRYEKRDIVKNPISRTFDVATLVEVLEHIPPSKLENFIKQVRLLVNPGGCMIATTPHKNKPLQDKHFQHFDVPTLSSLLDPYFKDLKFIPFDSHSKILSVAQLLLGGKGNNFVITNSAINDAFVKMYVKMFLYRVSESNCGRIAVVGKV